MLTAYDFLKDRFPLNKGGGEYAGPCPRCGGKDRFILLTRESPDRGGRFFCRQCRWDGDGIQLLREVLGMDYHTACEALDVPAKSYGKHGNTFPSARQPGATGNQAGAGCLPSAVAKAFVPREAERQTELWSKSAAALLDRLAGNLRTAAAHDLLKARGLSLETAERWGLAFNPENVFEFAEAWGLTGQEKKKIIIPAGLVLPTFGVDGTPLSIIVRRIQRDNKYPRFHEVKGSVDAPTVFGAVAGSPLIVLESYLDALLLIQEARGLCATVALNGAEKLPDAPCMALLKASPLVLLALDHDAAGVEAMKDWRKRIFPSARPCQSLDGKDVGDMARDDLYPWLVACLMHHGYCQIVSESGGLCSLYCVHWRRGAEWWAGHCVKRDIDVVHRETPCPEAAIPARGAA